MLKVRDFNAQSWNNPYLRRQGPSLWSRILGFAGVIVLSAGIIYALVYSPFLRIGKVEVAGAQTIDPVRIDAFVRQGLAGYEYLFWPHDYLLTVNTEGIRNRLLMQFPILRDVRIGKKFNKLIVTVEEKKPSYRLIIGDKSYLLDQDGIGLKEAAAGEGDSLITLSQDTAVYALGKALVPSSWLQPIAELHKYFATQVGVRDRLFALNPAEETITVISNEGWSAIMDPTQDIKTQLETLSSALLGKFSPAERQKLSYVDVRFGDKIFYKWR
jgi:cell division septal protein FtsQ